MLNYCVLMFVRIIKSLPYDVLYLTLEHCLLLEIFFDFNDVEYIFTFYNSTKRYIQLTAASSAFLFLHRING